MITKRTILKGSYYLPGVVVLIRLVFTVWVLFKNPMGLRFPFIQLIPMGVLLGSCFGHFKLYRDAVPVISLLLPTIAHAIIIFVFTREVMLLQFLPVFVPDVLYLVVKAVKANLYPFYMEGEDEDEFAEIDDIVDEAG